MVFRSCLPVEHAGRSVRGITPPRQVVHGKPHGRIVAKSRNRLPGLRVALLGLVGRDGQVTISSAIMRIMQERVLSASEFKAKCLACLDEVEQLGEAITITRRGRPVAVLGPAKHSVRKSPRNSWARKGRILGDIVNPDTAALWDVAGPE